MNGEKKVIYGNYLIFLVVVIWLVIPKRLMMTIKYGTDVWLVLETRYLKTCNIKRKVEISILFGSE